MITTFSVIRSFLSLHAARSDVHSRYIILGWEAKPRAARRRDAMKPLTDLREILRYVPQFRDRVFVIAIDGAVVEDENFRNLLTDVALLRSLNIRVALVHGAGHQVRRLAEQNCLTPSNTDGTGVTDAATLQLALHAATRGTHETLHGSSAADLV